MNRLRLVLLLTTILAGGCTHRSLEDVETTAAAPVTVMKVEPQTVRSVVTAAGSVAAAPGADWTITAPEAARIVELPKAEGDTVKTGDLLVHFEIPSLVTDFATRRAEGQQAQARLDNAQASVSRLTTLVQHGVAAQKDLEDARREVAEATASLEQSRSALQSASMLESRAVVRARFPGVVAKRAHNPGDMVEASASDVILRIVDPAKLQVLAAVAIADVQRVAVGKAAQISVAGADESESGKVLTRPSAVDAGGLSAPVRIAFDKPTHLPVGTPVSVEIVGEERQGALAVPVGAVLRDQDQPYVMVATADNKAQRRPVKLGLATPKIVEVTSGLKAGDRVIVRGQEGLPDGAAISVPQ